MRTRAIDQALERAIAADLRRQATERVELRLYNLDGSLFAVLLPTQDGRARGAVTAQGSLGPVGCVGTVSGGASRPRTFGTEGYPTNVFPGDTIDLPDATTLCCPACMGGIGDGVHICGPRLAT